MKRLILAMAILVLAVASTAVAAHSRLLSPGCYTHKCAQHQWFKHHPRAREASVTLSPLADCIIRFESTYNPSAANGIYEGYAQWSPEAWRRMGGLRFASHPTAASPAEQKRVLMDGLARFGCRDWCPFDPAPERC